MVLGIIYEVRVWFRGDSLLTATCLASFEVLSLATILSCFPRSSLQHAEPLFALSPLLLILLAYNILLFFLALLIPSSSMSS